MKILCVGGGSMGRRRLRDLTHLYPGQVTLFEPVEDRCREIAGAFGVRGVTRVEDGLAEKPDAMTVSTPPALHEPYVRKAMEVGVHVFAEVPFVLDEAALTDIAARAPSYPKVLGVSHTPRYYPPFRLIDDLLKGGAIGRPLYLGYSLGNYLPDWHPYEDYRKFYAGDAKLGGAGLDMILHELNTIQWWLGPVRSVLAKLTKVSTLEINGPDNHDMLLTFESGARGFFHNDVIERGTLGRHIRIAGDTGTLEWHQNLPTVRLFRDNKNEQHGFDRGGGWAEAMEASREMTRILARQKAKSGAIPAEADASFTYESCYLREMRHFTGAAEGKHQYTMATVADELQTVRAFHAVLASSERSAEVPVAA